MEDVSLRYKTMPLSKIDVEYYGKTVASEWRSTNNDRDDFLENRESYTQHWRNLVPQSVQPSNINQSNYSSPLTLVYGKAIHARLWQLFSDPVNFFGVQARREAFEEREEQVKDFMGFIIASWVNHKQGCRDVFDNFLWDNVFEGSGYLKLYLDTQYNEFMEVVPRATIEEKLIFNKDNLTGVTSEKSVKMDEAYQVKSNKLTTPQIKRILMEDIILPPGQDDPQTSDYVTHCVYLSDYDLKARVKSGKFDKSAVEKVIEHKQGIYKGSTPETQIKQDRLDTDGYSDSDYTSKHRILERYGRVYVRKDLENKIDDVEADLNEFPQEVVIWVHEETETVLGWTYLYTISPSGIRPIFKSDFIKFPDRSTGVGVAEVMAPIKKAVDAVYNLRQDNGFLSSMPWGVYRASSGLKPSQMKIEPGTLIPVDDPNQDIKMFQFPFLQGFGYQEEDRLVSTAERILTVSDLQLGRTPGKVGVFRTASGANQIGSESGIQLEIHFDRLARTLSKLLQALFSLARESISGDFYYRITGERGEPIFGKVNREDLSGDFDFNISIDVLGESRQEAQQKSTMLMQMMINPAFMNTGVVTPSNLYHLAKNFLIKNRVRRVDNYISEPQGYEGEVITPEQRIFRIVTNTFSNPDILDSVRLSENHDKAIKIYEGFKASDQYGLLAAKEQVQKLEDLIEKHNQMLAAQQSGGNPNMTGMQVPREGFESLPGGSTDQGTLGSPEGEANGPIV